DAIREALASFAGVQRRFTVKGEAANVVVVDDYGHHPAEIRATLEGARAAFPGKRIAACFPPHPYSRTELLFEDCATSFTAADALVGTDVFAAGEAPSPGVSGGRLAEAVRAHGHRDVRHQGRAGLAAALGDKVQAGDLVVTLGAGDIGQVT